MANFSERLKEAFDDLPAEKRTQSRLAAHCGIAKSSCSDWFTKGTKMPGADVLLKACEYLNVSPFWLVLGKGKKEPEGYIGSTEIVWPFELVSHSEFEYLTERQKGSIDQLLASEIAKISNAALAKKISA